MMLYVSLLAYRILAGSILHNDPICGSKEDLKQVPLIGRRSSFLDIDPIILLEVMPSGQCKVDKNDNELKNCRMIRWEVLKIHLLNVFELKCDKRECGLEYKRSEDAYYAYAYANGTTAVDGGDGSFTSMKAKFESDECFVLAKVPLDWRPTFTVKAKEERGDWKKKTIHLYPDEPDVPETVPHDPEIVNKTCDAYEGVCVDRFISVAPREDTPVTACRVEDEGILSSCLLYSWEREKDKRVIEVQCRGKFDSCDLKAIDDYGGEITSFAEETSHRNDTLCARRFAVDEYVYSFKVGGVEDTNLAEKFNITTNFFKGCSASFASRTSAGSSMLIIVIVAAVFLVFVIGVGIFWYHRQPKARHGTHQTLSCSKKKPIRRRVLE